MLRCEYLVNEYNMLSHAYNTCNVSDGNCSAFMEQSPSGDQKGKFKVIALYAMNGKRNTNNTNMNGKRKQLFQIDF